MFVSSVLCKVDSEILTAKHVDVGTVRNGKDVGWDFITPLTTVQLGTTVGVDGVTFVGIDGHAEKAGISLEDPTQNIL